MHWVEFKFNIARHVMMVQEEVELHQHHVMTYGSHWSFWSFWCSDVSGFHVFHVALKFQYLHTSALPPCTFALATLKTPGGGSDPGGIKATRGANGGLTMHIMCVKVMLHHHSLALRLQLGHHQWCLQGRLHLYLWWLYLTMVFLRFLGFLLRTQERV